MFKQLVSSNRLAAVEQFSYDEKNQNIKYGSEINEILNSTTEVLDWNNNKSINHC